jgi:shikimate kinase
MKIILFGFKGSGKTYFGKLLAQELRLPFVDSDTLIEKKAGISCRQLALEGGEEAFRIMEKQVIAELKYEPPGVFSIGGGAVLDPENVKNLLAIGTLIYLKIDKETVRRRLLSGTLPSYLNPELPEKSFEEMYAFRKPIYESLPAIPIEISGKSDSEVINAIKEGLYDK